MTVTIREADLIESVADALQFISYYHPMDYIRALGEAYDAEQAPAAIGPYSQGIRAGSLIITSGQLPIDMATGAFPATIEEQTRQSLENCKSVLAAAGATMENVIKTTVFLSDMNNFAAMNGVYATFFAGACPSRRPTTSRSSTPPARSGCSAPAWCTRACSK